MKAAKDSLYRFVVEGCNVRGQLVYLDEAWRTLANRHRYPMAVRRLLGEAVAAAALLSATIKFNGALTIQANGDGALRLLMAEATADGTLRGLARWHGDVHRAPLCTLLGNGRLAITIDPGTGRERYQGIVELRGDDLAEALRGYFIRSEQLPTRLWFAVGENRVAGLLLQRVPGDRGGDHDPDLDPSETLDAWRECVDLAESMVSGNLLELELDELLAHIHGDRRVRLFRGEDWRFVCKCSREKVETVLRALGRVEIDELIEERGRVNVNCEFCNAEFAFDSVDVAQLFLGDSSSPAHDTRH
jgi:molecular chaperone Hsp33